MRLVNRASALAARPDWGKPENLLRLGMFLAVLAIAATAIVLRETVTFRNVGYAGMFLTVLIGSGGLVIPVPALATACTTGALLNPVYVGLIAGGAGTIGELTGYYLGYSGQRILDRSRLYQRLEYWMRRRGWLLLLVISAVPNPIFDVVGVAAGALRYPIWRFLAVVLAGKLIKYLAVAYGCAYSVGWVTDLFGV